MKDGLRSALIITVFTFGSQLLLFVSQLVMAALFGANAYLDAFLAANTLPQYIITVLLGSLGFIFIPFFVQYKAQGSEEEAYNLAVSMFNASILVLAVLTLLGIAFAEPLLRLTAPGLSGKSLEMAVKAAMIMWPTILASGAVNILSSLYQAEKKFAWQSAVPLIGSVINLILLIILAPRLDIIGLAISNLAGVLVQALLLLPILARRGNYNFKVQWRNHDLIQIVRLLMPLVLVAGLTKFTPVFDRYLASTLPEGSISHLNYAFKIVSFISLMISTGGTTVIFPKMAMDVSSQNPGALRNTLSFGLRTMWLVTAPIITIGIPLALPLIALLLNRGKFTMADTVAVADILKIYLIALIAMCLGNVTGKGFYVQKNTKILAAFGIIEALAYVVYTYFLAKWMGVIGIALGFMFYYNLSLLWQLLVLNYTTGNKSGKTIVGSFAKTIAAAVLGGTVTYFLTLLISVTLLQILIGGAAGLMTYVVALHLFRSRELALMISFLPIQRLKKG